VAADREKTDRLAVARIVVVSDHEPETRRHVHGVLRHELYDAPPLAAWNRDVQPRALWPILGAPSDDATRLCIAGASERAAPLHEWRALRGPGAASPGEATRSREPSPGAFVERATVPRRLSGKLEA